MPKQAVRYADLFTHDTIAYYQKHICDFVEDIIFHDQYNHLGVPFTISEQQKEILQSIQDNRRVAIKSGRGIGKTGAMAWAIIWHLICFPPPNICICTAPTSAQVKDALWGEVGTWKSISLVRDILEYTSESLYLKELAKDVKSKWFAKPRTSNTQEGLSGLHAPNMLLIGDEASNIDDGILDVFHTTSNQPNNRVVLISNPMRVTGYFYDCFNKSSKYWTNHTFSAEDSPLVSQEHVEEELHKYGRDHYMFKQHISGEFPEGNLDAFLTLDSINDAIHRQVMGSGVVELGVDVARFGDDLTVVYWRHGGKVYPAKTMKKSSGPEVCDLVIKTVQEARSITGYKGKIKVKVDDTGVGGSCADFLKLDRQNNIEVIPCLFGGKGNDLYHNETAIMWGKLKDCIHTLQLPDEDQLKEELSARTWCEQSNKIKIQTKTEFKKDFKYSPDYSDALVMCVADIKPAKVVLKDFDPLDNNIVKNDLSYMGDERYGSIYYSKELYSSIVYTAWDGNKIFVYDEYAGDDPMVYVASNIANHGQLTRLFGNDKMFSKYGDSLEVKFRKHYRINVRENYKYDELGAMELITNMITQKKIMVSENCTKLIKQMSEWNLEGSKVLQETEYGLCYALMNIVSFLKPKIECGQMHFQPVMYGIDRNPPGMFPSQIKKKRNWMYF